MSRFEREWRLMAALEHPNVIGIYEAGEVDGRLYLAMRWVPGGDLAARLRGTAGLDPRVAVELPRPGRGGARRRARARRRAPRRQARERPARRRSRVADRLRRGQGPRRPRHAHGAGPLGRDGRLRRPGAARRHRPRRRADVYSLGCVLFEALTGRVPFPRDTEVATLWAHRFEPPPSTTDVRPGLPRALDDVLRRMLAKEPAERPASAGEALRAAARRSRRRRRARRTVVAGVPHGRPTRRHRRAPDARRHRSSRTVDARRPPEQVRARRRLLAARCSPPARCCAGAGVVAGLVLAATASRRAPRDRRARAVRRPDRRSARAPTPAASRPTPTFAFVADGPNREVIAGALELAQGPASGSSCAHRRTTSG